MTAAANHQLAETIITAQLSRSTLETQLAVSDINRFVTNANRTPFHKPHAHVIKSVLLVRQSRYAS